MNPDQPLEAPVGNPQHASDWTQGPAKWGAVVVLGIASMIGAGRAMLSGHAAGVTATTAREGSPDETPASLPVVVAKRININTATAVELELLPGIGPSLAKRIVDDRDAHGAFTSAQDLDRVKGIGPRLLEKLRDRVTVE